ncbi:hypothetical protein FGU71_11055 [Erythrobacter insulae]|uniref:Uncharacterized protein n=1 Tax=Erythrobacter insulae TaxID=2584124 RepID=A0A547PDY5_9SPHN|nr:hypothetical protein FGU71_11055 [Erythrobacter insulae]
MLCAPVSAREIDRAEIAEDFAPDVPQEQRVYCMDTRMFTLADGTEYRACTNWRAQVRTRLIRTYAALDGPEIDSDANIDLARTCFDLAIASQNDPYRTTFNDDTFLAGARSHFTLCATNRAMQRTDEYSLKVYDRGVWLG